MLYFLFSVKSLLINKKFQQGFWLAGIAASQLEALLENQDFDKRNWLVTPSPEADDFLLN